MCVGLDEFYEIVDVGVGNVEDIDEGGTIDIVVNDLGKGIDVFWCVAEVWVEHTDGEAEEEQLGAGRDTWVVFPDKLGTSLRAHRKAILACKVRKGGVGVVAVVVVVNK